MEENLRKQIWEEEMEMVEEHNREAEVKYNYKYNYVWEFLIVFYDH